MSKANKRKGLRPEGRGSSVTATASSQSASAVVSHPPYEQAEQEPEQSASRFAFLWFGLPIIVLAAVIAVHLRCTGM